MDFRYIGVLDVFPASRMATPLAPSNKMSPGVVIGFDQSEDIQFELMQNCWAVDLFAAVKFP